MIRVAKQQILSEENKNVKKYFLRFAGQFIFLYSLLSDVLLMKVATF
jgi:hypothetical protein